MSTYITEQGDTWDQIAYKALGDELMVDNLLQANFTLLETLVFPAGVTINLPEVTDVDDDDDDSLLPDWRIDDDPDDSDEDDDSSYDDEDDDDIDTDTDDDQLADEDAYDGIDMG
ncbi:tail protein X [Eubacterium pyruvativorans]|uniref:tail protein X n=1 Tax=Eubacterium pyruvativorans TaxID=155865 RepID=UPI0015633BAA|nr:tail protein X [Eubacterium pyruvativorans]